jgi:hypothetical protein
MQTFEQTTSTSPRAADDAAVRRQQMLAIGIMAVIVIAVAGFGLWRWQSTRLPDEPLVEVSAGGGGFFNNRPMPAAAVDGVRKVGDSSYRIKSGDASVFVSQPKSGGLHFGFSYQPNRPMTGPDSAVLMARYNSAALKLTKEQIDRIEHLPAFNSGMVVSDADRAKFASLWDAYMKADGKAKPEAENALVVALREIGTRSFEPTRAAIQGRVATIREILTPEQVDILTNPRRARPAPPPPASNPAP